MGKIVHADELPNGDFYITEGPFYNRIKPDRLNNFLVRAAKPFGGTLAKLLLENESTAIYHLDCENIDSLGDDLFIRPLLLGVNYHNGHSEGDYKVIVQNIPERKGPWVLFKPTNSIEKTFYLQHMAFPKLMKPKFEEEVANPLKIKSRYLYNGNPLEIFESFKESGFSFVDSPL